MYHSFSEGVGSLEEYCGWVWTENFLAYFQWWFWMEAHIRHWEWMFFLLNGIQLMEDRKISQQTLRPCQGGSHVTRLNFKMSCVGVYKCLLLIVSFAVTVAIWPREVVSCRNFILRSVTTFSAMSLVGIYPGRASTLVEQILLKHFQWLVVSPLVCRCVPDCHVR